MKERWDKKEAKTFTRIVEINQSSDSESSKISQPWWMKRIPLPFATQCHSITQTIREDLWRKQRKARTAIRLITEWQCWLMKNKCQPRLLCLVTVLLKGDGAIMIFTNGVESLPTTAPDQRKLQSIYFR